MHFAVIPTAVLSVVLRRHNLIDLLFSVLLENRLLPSSGRPSFFFLPAKGFFFFGFTHGGRRSALIHANTVTHDDDDS